MKKTELKAYKSILDATLKFRKKGEKLVDALNKASKDPIRDDLLLATEKKISELDKEADQLVKLLKKKKANEPKGEES